MKCWRLFMEITCRKGIGERGISSFEVDQTFQCRSWRLLKRLRDCVKCDKIFVVVMDGFCNMIGACTFISDFPRVSANYNAKSSTLFSRLNPVSFLFVPEMRVGYWYDKETIKVKQQGAWRAWILKTSRHVFNNGRGHGKGVIATNGEYYEGDKIKAS